LFMLVRDRPVQGKNRNGDDDDADDDDVRAGDDEAADDDGGAGGTNRFKTSNVAGLSVCREVRSVPSMSDSIVVTRNPWSIAGENMRGGSGFGGDIGAGDEDVGGGDDGDDRANAPSATSRRSRRAIHPRKKWACLPVSAVARKSTS